MSGGGSSAAATWLRGRGSIPVSWGRPPAPFWPGSARRRLGVRAWLRQQVSRSLLVGGMYGALSGMLPGLLMGLIAGAASEPLAWNLLFAVGGATAGLSRGWQPGYRLAALVDRWIGWRRFWRGFGMVTGAVLGLTVGLVFAVAVFPVILGPLLGGRAGIGLGEKVWNSGRSLGWERIWAGLGAMSTAGFGWVVAGLLGASVGSEWGPNVVFALEYGGVRPLLTTILAGGFCSALGGLAAGILTDFVAGLLGLAD
jgi:hypothetical protein